MKELIEFTKKAEGEVRMPNGNHKLYKCPAGYWTIGHGYNLDANGLPDDIAELLLDRCLENALHDAQQVVDNFFEIGEVRQCVLGDMVFNMGKARFSNFKNMIAAIERNDFEAAAREMINSNWYKQVGKRAVCLVKSMSSGVWHEYE